MLGLFAGPRITRRDRTDAHRWVMLMLDEPDVYAQQVADWIERKPARRDVYVGLLKNVDSAARASALMSLSKVQGRRPGPVHRWWNASPMLAALSALVAACAFAWFVSNALGLGTPGVVAAASARTLTTGIGEVRTESLDDGSSIVLDTDSEARVDFTAQHRDIEILRGRARIIVAHDPDRPLKVRAGAVSIEPSGRVFDVSVNEAAGNTVSVAAIEGGLDLRTSEQTSAKGQLLPVRAGQAVIVAGIGEAKPAIVIARASDQQWVTGMRSFDDAAISEVIAEANRYSTVKLELADPSLGSRRIFADIEIRDIEKVAAALAGFLHLEIDSRRAGRLILTKRR
ncbi:FecR domain-containing protein (plasmid) [Novosphingobium resinovorum]|uniref:FecR protein domain-containing protein n=1 Tax=Novosphingobium resinovorum TaxID=158500 RepID=A0A1D8AFK1_9SPHN|nr:MULTISPECIES: FecR domain-containing protein [Novosphingobium]AOR80880.1 hypothetical protein BES08_29235 [Novosphingobium resinovorum]MBF7015093.1 FecR domain-containing protein [Novosphingobium sp. HR1a]WJM29778.1 FecR domain-containing protein [Novosphingobium resinovorum]